MDFQKSPFFRIYLPAALTLTIIGWAGVLLVTNLTLPTLGPRWFFFFAWVMALAGPALPVVYFFHMRFPSKPLVEPGTITRQATWVGVLGATLMWLSMGMVLNSTVVVILLVALIVIEILLRLRERSRFNPSA